MTTDYQAINADLEQEKDNYLNWIADGIYMKNDAPKERTCSRCKEIYYYIRNKEQLLKAIEDKITGEKPFHIEMIRFYEYADFAGKDTYYIWDDDNMCGCCKYYTRKKQNKKGFFQRIKERLSC